MNVVDSSFWIEFFLKTNLGYEIFPIINDIENLIVPTICFHEVFKKILRDKSEEDALLCATFMKNGNIIYLDEELALSSGYLGLKLKLPLADSIIYAVTQKYNATLYTLDKHFAGLDNVKYFEKI